MPCYPSLNFQYQFIITAIPFIHCSLIEPAIYYITFARKNNVKYITNRAQSLCLNLLCLIFGQWSKNSNHVTKPHIMSQLNTNI